MAKVEQTFSAALGSADNTLSRVLRKAGFWAKYAQEQFNPRQRLVLNKLLDNFEGKLTATKWAKLTKRSPDTALRDITDLVDRGILTKDPGGGRSTSYSLNFLYQPEDRGPSVIEDLGGNLPLPGLPGL